MLDGKRLREEGFFEPAPIRRMWQEHVAGVRRWHYYLWDVLMFQAWNEEQGARYEPRAEIGSDVTERVSNADRY
ncbi:asparagine synthase-related protein [Aquisalimonas lutea]|uniref:asparagine synthase-related protein n=1 Tax=Aquisalimonas lutea TaxID=1327750 RepID=UPI0025B4902B|nr:asparagine synthase-related protein [Aquisalimonas lutea]MDN3517830.1 asparagine synthase-related protein [Aquisalimonas lutea]